MTGILVKARYITITAFNPISQREEKAHSPMTCLSEYPRLVSFIFNRMPMSVNKVTSDRGELSAILDFYVDMHTYDGVPHKHVHKFTYRLKTYMLPHTFFHCISLEISQ